MADNFTEGIVAAIVGFASDVLIKALFFNGDFGTDYGWLFILIGVIIILCSAIEAIKECDTKGVLFSLGYLIGLIIVH